MFSSLHSGIIASAVIVAGLSLSATIKATDVLAFHNDLASTGQNLSETVLTPSIVNTASFGKLFMTKVDGGVFAQPLVKTKVTIATGHYAGASKDVVFVATEQDSLYAIDANSTDRTGSILWQRSFLDITNPFNNTLHATKIDVVGTVMGREFGPFGITGTPVIDPGANILYLVAKTKETIGGTDHYVQRLHAINLSDGNDLVPPFLIGHTTVNNNNYTNNTQIYVYGAGDGNVQDPYNGTTKAVVQFNALVEHQRGALSLDNNNTVYVPWAAVDDAGPYHGWIVAWDVSGLKTGGFRLKGVFNTSPNGAGAGIWQGGGRLAFEADGSAFYFETGNGPVGHPAPTLDSVTKLPADGSYYDALVKVTADATTNPKQQGMNGWGLKVADYFIPYDQVYLDTIDLDLGSGAPMILPDSAGIPGHPHLLVAGGKEGKIYLVDRDNMGKYDPSNDNVLNAVPDGAGHKTPPAQMIGGMLSTPAYFFNGTVGRIYLVSGYEKNARTFVIKADGTLSKDSESTVASFGSLAGSPSVSASGTNGGIVWVTDRHASLIHAYTDSFSTELWNSGQKVDGSDSLGVVQKFAVPTVANGKVFVGTSDGSLVAYGPIPPVNAVPNAPTLAANVESGTSIKLTWTDNTPSPNDASYYEIEQSTDGTNFTRASTAPSHSSSRDIGALSPQTTYVFRIRGDNSFGPSAYSQPVRVTTQAQGTNAPPPPTGLGGLPVSDISIQLSWKPTANGPTDYILDRALDQDFTQGLITLPFTSPDQTNTYIDKASGLSPGHTFYYRIRASNAAGVSADSNRAGIAIPPVPPVPTSARLTKFTTSEISLCWMDNAGGNALWYSIFRRVGTGTSVEYIRLPASSQCPPSFRQWTDTNLTPNTDYDYHIFAANFSGHGDFTGASARTSTVAPSDLTARAGKGAVTLSWTAPARSVSYNIYRGITPNGEGDSPIVTGWATTSYTDRQVANDMTYYYRVTATNGNISSDKRLSVWGRESSRSNEASTKPYGE